GRGVSGFVASRVGRLFPAYWACIVVTVALQHVWSGGRQTTLFETLVNLTMVQDLFEVTGVQVVFWTLLVELKFYLLVLVVLGRAGARRRLARGVAGARLRAVLLRGHAAVPRLPGRVRRRDEPAARRGAGPVRAARARRRGARVRPAGRDGRPHGHRGRAAPV